MKSAFAHGEALAAPDLLLARWGSPLLAQLQREPERWAELAGLRLVRLWATDLEIALQRLKQRLGAETVAAALLGDELLALREGKPLQLQPVEVSAEADVEARAELEEQLTRGEAQFVTLELFDGKDTAQLLLELFTAELPGPTRHFLELCEGIAITDCITLLGAEMDEHHPGLYLAFNVPDAHGDLPPLRPGPRVYAHDTPGLVGFLARGVRTRGSHRSFYITLDALRGFDGCNDALGRVVAGLDFLRGAAPPLRVTGVEVHARSEPPTAAERRDEAARRADDFPAQLSFERRVLLSPHSPARLGGPRALLFARFPAAAFEGLAQMQLGDCRALRFDDCSAAALQGFVDRFLRRESLFPALEELRLRDCTLSAATLAGLLGATGLRSLALDGVGLDEGTDVLVAAAAATDGFARLRELRVEHCRLSADSLRALPGLRLPGLETLSLRGNCLFDEGATALLAAARLPRLRSLDLAQTSCTARGLAHALRLDLRALDVSHNCELDELLRGLARGDGRAALTRLSLRNCRAGFPAVQALLGSPRAGLLRELDLAHNPRWATDFCRLAARLPFLQRLRALDLSHNRLGNADLAGLALARGLPSLAVLDLCGNAGLAPLRFFEEECSLEELRGWQRLAAIRLDADALGAAEAARLRELYQLRVEQPPAAEESLGCVESA